MDEKCCGPLVCCCGDASAEHDVVVVVLLETVVAAKFGVTNKWLDLLHDGTAENAAEIPMTDDTADAATTAVAADRGRRDCRETISLFCSAGEINSFFMSKNRSSSEWPLG
jgi:hypothetical protein